MTRRPAPVVGAVLAVSVALGAVPARAAAPRWVKHVDRVVAGHPTSVVVGNDGHLWYRHKARIDRPPASNEKLLLSMALLDRFGTSRTFPVRALSLGVDPDGVIAGDLYLRGEGDPEVADARLDALAARIRRAGVRHIRGRVIGVRGPFHRDWFAPGWKSYFPREYVALPTALTFRGNISGSGKHITDPEHRAAAYLTRALRELGVTVGRRGTDGSAIGGLSEVASVGSKPLRTIVRHMDRRSINFSAEVLGKTLAYGFGDAGTIANGAARICRFEAAHGVSGICHDASGLSYANRQTAIGIVRLLWTADRKPWGGALRMALPDGGQGTLRHRLRHVRVRAKTGTLIGISALSGWVWSDAAHRWIEFSILSSGMSTATAKDLEDRVVEVLAAHAHAP